MAGSSGARRLIMPLLLLVLLVLGGAAAADASMSHYGHAYQAPADFTADEYDTIAHTFPVFTVEKRHAFAVYGNASAPASSPHRFNSIAAAVGTARHLKSLNSSIRVLMYWNSAIHYNMVGMEPHPLDPCGFTQQSSSSYASSTNAKALCSRTGCCRPTRQRRDCWM